MTEWREIAEVPFYEVSNTGRIRSWQVSKRRIEAGEPHELSLSPSKDGYIRAKLYQDGKMITRLVHRLVALSFIVPDLYRPFVNHKDGNRQNNSVENLEWVTSQENIIHSMRYGKAYKEGTSNPQAKATTEQVREIRERHANGETNLALLAEDYPIGYSQVWNIVRGKMRNIA